MSQVACKEWKPRPGDERKCLARLTQAFQGSQVIAGVVFLPTFPCLCPYAYVFYRPLCFVFSNDGHDLCHCMERRQDGIRKRVTNACLRCRQQKIRCSGRMPCEQCTKRKLTCNFNDRSEKIWVTRGYVQILRVAFDAPKFSLLNDAHVPNADS
jgi:hypothetical protein